MSTVLEQERGRRYRLRHPEKIAAIKSRWRQKNKSVWIDYCRRWRDADLPHARAIWLFNGAKKRAKKFHWEFDLSVVDIEARIRLGKCEVTGLPFQLEFDKGRQPWTPSLDRIIRADTQRLIPR